MNDCPYLIKRELGSWYFRPRIIPIKYCILTWKPCIIQRNEIESEIFLGYEKEDSCTECKIFEFKECGIDIKEAIEMYKNNFFYKYNL